MNSSKDSDGRGEFLMAVTPPTPPNPPTPPAVPQVTLQQGGSTTETTVPRNGSGPDPEEQARASVASGSGPLSTTTVNVPEDRKTPRQDNTSADTEANARQPAAAETQNQTVTQSAPQVPPLMDGGDLLAEPANAKNGTTQVPDPSSAARESSMGVSGYSPVYLASGFFFLFLIGVVFFFFLQKKDGALKGNRRTVSEKKPKPELNLTGQTAEEVMRALQEQQMARVRAAADAARREKKVPAPVSASVADQYRSQAEVKPESRERPFAEKTRVVRRNPKPEQEESHFEVRI